MRPRKLVLEGLRSYRSRQEIDFTDVGLMAIVGDTGAGKSSLLEAICVALYGSSTWDKRAVKQLISSGAQTLSVELTFEGDGKLWKVTRSTSRDNYPLAVHKLECLSDGTQLDGASLVNQKIQEVVGLSYDMFLRAVVLPQGRFQLLLQATGGERTSILKGIFRLEHLEAVRLQAEGRLDHLRPRLQELEVARSQLLPDPEASAAQARRAREQAHKAVESLEATRQAYEQARFAATEARHREAELRSAVEQAIERTDIEAIRDQLQSLAKVEEQLTETQRSQEREIGRLRAEIDRLAKQLNDAAGRRLGLGDLQRAEQALQHQREQLLRLDAKRLEIEEAARNLEVDREQLQALSVDYERAKQQASETEHAIEPLRNAVSKSSANLEEAERALGDARQAQEQLETDRGLTTTLEADLQKLDGQLAAARTDLSSSIAAAAQAEQDLTAAQHAHAAAFVAHGSAPGDPCPVCTRPLQEDWTAPAESGLEEAVKIRDKARSVQQGTEARCNQLEQQRIRALAQLDAQRVASGKAASALEAAFARLKDLGPSRGSDDDLTGTLLAPLEARVREAEAELEKRKGQWQLQRKAEAKAKELLDQAKTRIETSEHGLTKDRADIEKLAASIRKAIAQLPEQIRPAEPLENASYTPLLDDVARRLEALKALEKEKSERAKALQQAQDRLEETRRSSESQVKAPRSRLWQKLVQASASLVPLAKAVGRPGPDPPPEETGSPQLASYADNLAAECRALRKIADDASTEHRARLATAEADLERSLSKAGLASEAALATALIDAKSDMQTAQRTLSEAEAQIPRANDLDQRLGKARPFLDTLDELRRLLADGKFVGFVVQRKQQALLAVASQLLAQMTQNRYGFSENFEVVDRLAGEARDVKTLSGGETFLASLSLALGLVELAGRSGGRLEALFLDEGFATLDGNVLAEALDALYRQAEKGRLVAVISHLRSVAESIDRVLYVEKTPSGSHLAWLDSIARAALVDEEARLGLVS